MPLELMNDPGLFQGNGRVVSQLNQELQVLVGKLAVVRVAEKDHEANSTITQVERHREQAIVFDQGLLFFCDPVHHVNWQFAGDDHGAAAAGNVKQQAFRELVRVFLCEILIQPTAVLHSNFIS